jgi:hypothetical protein
MIRWDTLRNTGDKQEGVVYQIFDFVLHKKVVSQCNWHATGAKEIRADCGNYPVSSSS